MKRKHVKLLYDKMIYRLCISQNHENILELPYTNNHNNFTIELTHPQYELRLVEIVFLEKLERKIIKQQQTS